jgi:hypothetical protein
MAIECKMGMAQAHPAKTSLFFQTLLWLLARHFRDRFYKTLFWAKTSSEIDFTKLYFGGKLFG